MRALTLGKVRSYLSAFFGIAGVPNSPVVTTSGATGTLPQVLRASTTGGTIDYKHYYYPRPVGQALSTGIDRTAVRGFWADTASGSTTLGAVKVRCFVYTRAFELEYKAQSNEARIRARNWSVEVPTWRTIFDSTVKAPSVLGLAWPGTNGTRYYLKTTFEARHLVELEIDTYGYFYGLNLNSADDIAFPGLREIGPVPRRPITVADSQGQGSGVGATYNAWPAVMARALGLDESINVSSGGTGFLAQGSGKMRYGDRIVPPGDSWKLTSTLSGVTSVTFTYDGVTTASIAYSSNNQTFATNINAALATSFGSDALGRQNAEVFYNNHGWLFIGREGTGVKPTVAVTGGSGTFVAGDQWLGDVAPSVPVDAEGTELPFLLIIQASGNDVSQTLADVVTAFEEVLTGVAATFTTAKVIVRGIPCATNYLEDDNGTAGISLYRELEGLLWDSAKTNLPKINGYVPFIPCWSGTYAEAGIITDDWYTLAQCQNWATQDDEVHLTKEGQFVDGLRTAAYMSMFLQQGL